MRLPEQSIELVKEKEKEKKKKKQEKSSFFFLVDQTA
jgi:hypothetical protein